MAIVTDSAWLKIIRASKHLEELKNGIAADSTIQLDHVLGNSQGRPILDLPVPHETIAVLADEIIYHLRSALDHLALDLVRINKSGINLPAKWDENVAFPLWTNLKLGQRPPLPYGAFQNLPGISKEAHTIIEGVQPYYGPGFRAINNLMRFLVALSNINKHRRMQLTRTRGFYAVNIKHDNGITSSSAVSLDNGAELPDLRHPDHTKNIVEMDSSLSLFVSFDERDVLGDATDVRIEYLLELFVTHIVVDIYNPLRALIN